MSDESGSDDGSNGSDQHELAGKRSKRHTATNAAKKDDGGTETTGEVKKSGSKQPSSDSAPSAEGESVPRSVRGSGGSDDSGRDGGSESGNSE